MKTQLILRLALILAGCSLSYGAPVIHEPFSQSVTTNLNGVAASSKGLSGSNWTLNAASSWAITSGSVSWPALVPTGNKIAESNPATGSQAYVTIPAGTLASLPMADGQTSWFSVLLTTAADIGGSNPDFGFAIGSGLIGTTNNIPLGSGQAIGFTVKTGQLYASHWSTTTLTRSGTGKSVAASTTYLVVGKITWGATSDRIDIYLPDASLNLGSVQTTVTSTANLAQSGFNRITIGRKAGSAGNPWTLDEIRFGATYLDVVGVAPASTYWDVNSTADGAGSPADGNWDGVNNFWNSDATGGSAGSFSTTTLGNIGTFAAGSDATGTYGVTVTGSPSIGGLGFEEGTVTVSGGTALDLVSAGGAIEVRQPSGSATIATPISQSSGTGSLYKEGGGTLILSGANTYDSNTIMNAGTLILSGDNSGALGSMTLNAGITRFDSTLAIPGSGRSVNLTANAVAMFGSALTSADITTGLGRFVAASPGVIAADNNDGDDFDFNTGGLTAAFFGAVGSVNYTGTLTPNSTAKYRLGGGGGTLTLANANALTGANAVTVTGPGTVVISNANNVSADTTIAVGGTLVVGNSAALGNRKVTFSGTGNLILASDFSTGANQIFYVNGAKIMSDGTTPRSVTGVLKGNSTHTLVLGDSVNNGKLTFTSSPLGTSGGFNMNCLSDVEFTNSMTIGTDALTKTGAGTMVISANSNYTGATNANAGTLAAAKASAFGSTSNINIAGGVTLSLRGDSSTSFVKASDSALYTMTTTGSGATINVDQATVAGTSTKTMTIGTLGTTSTANTYQVNFTGANNTSLNVGAMTGPAAANNTTKGTVTINNTIASGGSLTLASYTSANAGTSAGAGETVVFGGTGETTVTGMITPSVNPLALTKSGTGTLVLSSTSSTFTGQVLSDAGILRVMKLENAGIASSLGTGNANVIRLGNNDTATLEYVGTTDSSTNRPIQIGTNNATNTGNAAVLNNSVSGKLTFSNTAFNANTSTNTVTVARALTLGGDYAGAPNEIQGAIQDNNTAGGGTVSLTKTGASTWVLSGTNTYTGSTTVSSGTLALSSTGSIANSASVSLGAAGTLDTSAQTTYTIPGAQPVTISIDPAGAGSSGKIVAAGLDITNAVVTLSPTATLDDPVYVLATYTGTLGGSQFAAPLPTVPSGYTLNYAYQGNKIALVQSTSGYASWQANNSPGGAINADHDGDGVANGIEFFLQGPGANNSFTPLPGVTNVGGFLKVTWVRNAGYPGFPANYSTDFVVETSDSLTGIWNPASLGTNSGQVEISGNNVTYTFPDPLGAKKFARLTVTGPN